MKQYNYGLLNIREKYTNTQDDKLHISIEKYTNNNAHCNVGKNMSTIDR